MAVKPIPDGYHSVTPYLILDNASKAIEFYKKVFDATELVRMPGPGGAIMHAEIKIGDSVVMLADESAAMGQKSAKSMGGSPMGIMVYVTEVDKTYQKAIAAGGTVDRPVKDQFYGDRSGSVLDPFGYKWNIGTHIEDVSPEEMKKRMAALFGPK
jgi:PhnB protein